ncbi:hypothetical protein B0J17DRAFT_709889, partial [Rhizoctonia solani]
MTIQPGVYNINNNHNNYAMMMYGNEEAGTPLTCIDGTNSQTQFNVKETGQGTNRYTIGSDKFKYNVGADPKNLTGKPHPSPLQIPLNGRLSRLVRIATRSTSQTRTPTGSSLMDQVRLTLTSKVPKAARRRFGRWSDCMITKSGGFYRSYCLNRCMYALNESMKWKV